jgi:porphobilinogen deaminase
MSDLWSQIIADILNKIIIQMANSLAAGKIDAALIASSGIKRLGSFREKLYQSLNPGVY